MTPEGWASRGGSMWNYRELLLVTDSDESVVVINTGAGCKTPDKLGKAARERADDGDGDGSDA